MHKSYHEAINSKGIFQNNLISWFKKNTENRTNKLDLSEFFIKPIFSTKLE